MNVLKAFDTPATPQYGLRGNMADLVLEAGHSRPEPVLAGLYPTEHSAQTAAGGVRKRFGDVVSTRVDGRALWITWTGEAE